MARTLEEKKLNFDCDSEFSAAADLVIQGECV